jgi:hypothetical protein
VNDRDAFLDFVNQPFMPREGATTDKKIAAATAYTAHHIGEISRKLSELIEIMKRRDQSPE